MVKRSKAQSPEKISKHEKKQPLNHDSIKILRPKVYITNSTNFKYLVQQLTGKTYESPPPSLSASHPNRQVLPFAQIEGHAYQENSFELSFDSSCFSTPLEEGSPDVQVKQSHESFNDVILDDDPELGRQKNVDTYSFEYGDFESFFMDMDLISSCEAPCNYGMIQQEVCVYDYDILSTLI